MTITCEWLRSVMSYNAETGELRWVRSVSNSVRPGDLAGSVSSLGYVRVQIKGRLYKAHRLAWMLAYGEMPKRGIDHVNGNKGDNRLANLREATPAENSQNLGHRQNNTSGYPGVSWFKPVKKWRARITVNRKERTLGYFDTKEAAAAAYLDAKARLHTFQPTMRLA